jgi:hypothetical protein
LPSCHEIIVWTSGFYAAYAKPSNQPQLILRRRSETENYELLARAWQAANTKARELGSLQEFWEGQEKYVSDLDPA